jgi:hypothetical protein
VVDQLKFERGMPPSRQGKMQLWVCSARVFVESNGVAAGMEALVLEDGVCNVARTKFLKVLRTFHYKENIRLTADAGGLRMEGFLMKVTKFSPVTTAPGEFQVFPVRDGWLAAQGAPKPPTANVPSAAPDESASPPR